MICMSAPGVGKPRTARSGAAVAFFTLALLALPGLSQNGVSAFRTRGQSKRGTNRGRCNQSSDYCAPMAAIATVTSFSATSATINWTYVAQPSTILNRGAVRQVRLQLREVGPGARAGWLTRSTISGRVRSHTLRNLKPGQRYRVRLVTINEHGTNREGKRSGHGHVQFQTKEHLALSCTPKQQAVRVGERAEFRCQATGGPNLAISTRLTARAAVEQRRLGGSHQLIITFQNIQRSQDQTTHCVYARTTNRHESRCFQILIQEPIRIQCLKVHPCGRRVSSSSRLNVRCNVYGYPLPNVTWYFNGEPVTNTRNKTSGWRILPKKQLGSRRDEDALNVGFQHRLRAALTRHDQHTGQLTLVARNRHAERTSSQDVVITDTRSQAVIEVPTHDVESGRTLSITCHTNIGQSGLQFRWYHKPRGSQHYQLLDPDTPGIIQSRSGHHHRLLVPQANVSHGGEYRCEASNSHQCRVTAKAAVLVRAPLYVTIGKTDGWQLLELNKPAVINCHIRSSINNRLPVVYWRINGQIIGLPLKRTLSRNVATSWHANQQPVENQMATSGRAMFQLRTESLRSQDLGLIHCVADGQDGFIQEDSVNVISRGEVRVMTEPSRSRLVRSSGQIRVVCNIFTDNSPELNSDVRRADWLHRPTGKHVRAKLKPVNHESGIEVTRRLLSQSSKGTYQQLILDITNFSSDKAGVYVCRVPGSWDYGSNRVKPPRLPHASIKLHIKDGPVPQIQKEMIL